MMERDRERELTCSLNGYVKQMDSIPLDDSYGNLYSLCVYVFPIWLYKCKEMSNTKTNEKKTHKFMCIRYCSIGKIVGKSMLLVSDDI